MKTYTVGVIDMDNKIAALEVSIKRLRESKAKDVKKANELLDKAIHDIKYTLHADFMSYDEACSKFVTDYGD